MKNINIFFKIATLMLGLILVGCNEDLIEDKEIIGTPVITDFSPKSGKVGTEIKITGQDLGKIDSVWIGGGLAELKYLINPSEMVVKVTANSRTGKILISGTNGKTETSENFTMLYVAPKMTNFPTTAKSNEEIFIEGENMDAVMSVFFGTTQAEIISKSEKDMVVKVPFFEDDNVDIILKYNVENGVNETGTTGKPFSLDRVIPVIGTSATEAEIGASITITGENLTLIDEAWFGNQKAIILQKEDTYVTLSVPSEFTATTEVIFKMIYYGNKELIVVNNFKVIVPDQKKIHYWENVTIFANDESTPNNFFNATTGEIYTPCDYEGAKNNIYFFLTISASSIQLNNPANSANQTKNFKCEGVALPTETMPNIVKFKTLKESVEVEKAYIDKVKNKALESITVAEIEAAELKAGTNAPRYYGNENNQIAPGDVLLVQQFDSSGNVIKVGFIEIINFTTTNPATDKTSSMTFNCYFQK